MNALILPHTEKRPRMMNEKKLASLLGVSVSKVQKDRARNVGVPYCKIGRSVRYNIEDVNAYIASIRKGP